MAPIYFDMSKETRFADSSPISEDEIKNFMTLLVKQASNYPIIYKYLTFESGCKMLQYNNLQFTRGDRLNDTEDLNITKFNTSAPLKILEGIESAQEIANNHLREQEKVLSSFAICSLGISPMNPTLWNRYACDDNGRENGICIGLNQNKVTKALIAQGIKTACIMVRYEDSVENAIPWLALGAPSPVRIFSAYKFFALKKSIPWKPEQEMRFIYPQTIEDEYKRIVLPKDCFEWAYYGKDMSLVQKQIIGQIISRNLPKMKRVPLMPTS